MAMNIEGLEKYLVTERSWESLKPARGRLAERPESVWEKAEADPEVPLGLKNTSDAKKGEDLGPLLLAKAGTSRTGEYLEVS